jgi:multiple sugar transport system substrate-binding protein
LSAVQELTTKGKLIGGTELADMLQNSAKPVFPEGAPVWYPEFSRAVYTSLHSAATGEITVDQAIQAIVDTANKQSSGS